MTPKDREAERVAAGLTEAQRKVFDFYRTTPEAGRSSYLHDHYRRGVEGLKRPPLGAAAYGAWLAGTILKGAE